MAQQYNKGDRWYDAATKRWYEHTGDQWALMAEGEWPDVSSSTELISEPTLSRRDEMALRIFQAIHGSYSDHGYAISMAIHYADEMIEALDGSPAPKNVDEG